MLDTRTSVVYLPPPAKHYLISKALRVYSHQTLKLDPTSVIRRADNACDYMLTNDDLDKGNEHIVISGGVWDGNNAKNPRRPMPRNGENPRTFFTGSTMLLMHVNHLLIEKAMIKDPEKFGVNIGACHKFTVDNIVFDYNALRGNMDGVHVHGGSSVKRMCAFFIHKLKIHCDSFAFPEICIIFTRELHIVKYYYFETDCLHIKRIILICL
jgi:polygalacturonase